MDLQITVHTDIINKHLAIIITIKDRLILKMGIMGIPHLHLNPVVMPVRQTLFLDMTSNTGIMVIPPILHQILKPLLMGPRVMQTKQLHPQILHRQ